MMAHEQGEEIDPVGGAPGPITREEMSTLKHAMKEQESRDAQQRPSGGRGAPGLPATASWGKGNYAGPPSAPHLGPHTAFYPPISASLPPASASAPSAQRSASQSGSSTSKVSAVPSAAPAPKDPKLQRQSSQSAIGQPASKPIAARQNSVHHEEAPSAAAAAAATSAASTAEAAQQPEATSAPSTKRAADPIPPPALPPPPPGLGGPPPPPPGLSQPLASAGPTPSTSAQTIEERDFDPGFEPFSAGTGAFTFNFNMDAAQHSQEKQLPPFDLDSRPPGSTGLSDGLFSAADLLLSPPPAHPNKIYDGPDVPYTGAFNPFADASPGAEEPDARPKSSRFEFAKKGKGLFGSSDELSALGGAGVSMPPVEAPPGIAAPRGFPNGLLGQGASPSSMFTGAAPPAPGRTESPRQNVTSPPPGLKPTNGDSWTPAGLESLLTGRGTSPLSRSPRDQQHAHMPLSPFNNNNSNNSSMSIASAALPALSSAATQPLPPPSGGPSPLPPGFSHLANQPLPSALASASAYPLPPPTGNSATSGRTPNAPPGLAPPSQQPQAPQRPGSSTPTSPSANKDSNDLFGHLLSLAGSSNLIPSRSMAGKSFYQKLVLPERLSGLTNVVHCRYRTLARSCHFEHVKRTALCTHPRCLPAHGSFRWRRRSCTRLWLPFCIPATTAASAGKTASARSRTGWYGVRRTAPGPVVTRSRRALIVVFSFLSVHLFQAAYCNAVSLPLFFKNPNLLRGCGPLFTWGLSVINIEFPLRSHSIDHGYANNPFARRRRACTAKRR